MSPASIALSVLTMATANTYYIDAVRGRDTNGGTSRKTAWQSARPLSTIRLKPGDRVLFAGGQRFQGNLCLEGLDGPITVSSFGKGRAVIDGGNGDALVVEDCARVAVKGLDFVGAGRKNGSDGRGIVLRRTRTAALEDLDVSGFRIAGIETGGDEDTLIRRVVAHDNGFAGISVHGGHSGLPRSKRVVIRDCIARDNPGDPKNRTGHSGNGILVSGVDGCLIDRCVATNNGWDMPRKGNGPVGIWAWNADRVTIQRCISYANRSPGADGGGFDFDGGVTNSVLQYNLSYDNEGCGYLLCQFSGATRWRNNVVRYNVSYNDGSRNMQAGIGLWTGDLGIWDAEIYNNTIVNPHHAVYSMGALPGFVYRNNLFVCGGDALVGDFSRSRFEGNRYQAKGNLVAQDGKVAYDDRPTTYRSLDEWVLATGQERIGELVVGTAGEAGIVLPRRGEKLPTDPRDLEKMPFFRLAEGSDCIGAGRPIKGNGGRDLFGNRLSGRPSIGAHEP
ncbi:MAG TPA: right-handed parallel beta-helix repeat-containing protein [Fimbriimonas sp.]